MSFQQKVVKGVLWTSIQNWGSQALFFVTFLVLARLLGPETFGLVSLSTIFIHLIQALLGQGFSDAIIQRKDLDREHLDTAFWANFGIGLFLFILGVISAPAIALAFKQPDLIPIVRWMSLLVVFNSVNTTQQAILRREMNFKALAARQLAGQLAGTIVAITLALMNFGVWSLVCQQLVTSIVGTLLLWKITRWRPKLKFSVKHFRDLYRFGINVVGINILTFLNVRGDDLLIGYFLGPVALGYYTVAYKMLVTLTQLLTDTIRQVVLPSFSRLQNDLEKMRRAFYTATELVGFVTLPAFLGMAVLAPELVLGLFGDQWQPSIPVMQCLAFVGVARALVNFTGAVIMAMGKPSWSLMLSLSDTLVRIIAFAIAVQWGIVAVAIALVISTYLFAPIRLVVVNQLIPLDFLTYCKQFIPPLLGSGVMVVSLLTAKQFLNLTLNAQFLLGLYILIGALAYGLTTAIGAPDLTQRLLKLARIAGPLA
ncbi:MOP flippase family protein [Lyngbya confervoides]|uniref:MOP flippase family protein n=1 Tax=Lyngbya confervoides BDU141951 TaxID=1574623 RepID=A0ABD4T8F1_9CYAN|nr:MOP flippase family protein [Lyngbya confervoides]MCM1984906.1 MOP flippase family protein [Lyngbya confervoides BDU141951]